VVEFGNLTANVQFCFENECNIDLNKWILSDGKVTITCIKYGCFVKVDNFTLKFKKTKQGYVELDPAQPGIAALILDDNDAKSGFRQNRFKGSENSSSSSSSSSNDPNKYTVASQ